MSTLLLGYPGPMAVRAAHSLAESSESLLVVGREDASARLPPRCEFLGGASSSVDFGLGRRELARLAGEVTEVVAAESVDHLMLPVSDIEGASVVRVAAELREFVAEHPLPLGVRFLSSLRIFGNWSGSAAEADFAVGQSFVSRQDEALAVAEKQLRMLPSEVNMAIVRVAPVIGSHAEGLWRRSDVARLLALARVAPDEVEVHPSEELVLYETVERAVEALLSVPLGSHHQTYHVLDDEPWSERQLVEWVCDRWEKRLAPVPRSASAWNQVFASGRTRTWKVPTFLAMLGRAHAEESLGELLHRDQGALLSALADTAEARVEEGRH